MNNKYFFITTYLPRSLQLQLEIKLSQIPFFRITPAPPFVQPDDKIRNWDIPIKTNSEFEKFAKNFIPKMIPALYLEGYNKMIQLTDKLHWPKKPDVIWTSNSVNSDDVFKLWVAQKVEEGSKLVIGQHGGHYGIGKWYFNESHEIAICDKYFSWGWTDPLNDKITPVGQLKSKKPLGINHYNQDGLLLVNLTMPRYSYYMYSTIISKQYLDYLEDQFSFVNALPNNLVKRLTVRLYQHDYGWQQKHRWQAKFPKINLDSGKTDLNKLIKKSRVYISTYNATTFLESLSMNVPTVIFWNPQHWEIRKAAQPYFDNLKNVGIFHDTPKSAADHIIENWDNIDKWWENKKTKHVVKNFCKVFSNTEPGLLNRLEQGLRFK